MAHAYLHFPPGCPFVNGRPVGVCVCGRWADDKSPVFPCPNGKQGPPDPIEVFTTLLKNSSIAVNPRVLGVLVNDKGFRCEAGLCSIPAHALALYMKVANALSTNAKKELEHMVFDDGKRVVMIDERVFPHFLSSTFIYRAFWKKENSSIQECYFKIKTSGDCKKENDVWNTLSRTLTPDIAKQYFVEVQLVEFNLINHPDINSGLMMPIYLGTLMEIPACVSEHIMQHAYNTISVALRNLHAIGLVHCDIKPNNIFRCADGSLRVGDYDACTTIGQPVTLSTRVFWPQDLKDHETSTGYITATPGFDFAMLAATLLFLVDEWSLWDGQKPTLQEMRDVAQEKKYDAVLECLSKV